MDFWIEVERLEEALGDVSYFDLLGVKQNATAVELTDAYHAALRRFHPDRHAVGSSPEQKAALARICARIGEAFRTLSTPAGRAAYLNGETAGSELLARRKRGTVRETRDPKTEKARSLLASARELFAAGNRAAAVAKIDLALQFEPQSLALADARSECEPSNEKTTP